MSVAQPVEKKRKRNGPVLKLPAVEGTVLVVFPPPFFSKPPLDNFLLLFRDEESLLLGLRKAMREARTEYGISWSEKIENDLDDPDISDETLTDRCRQPLDNFNNGFFVWGDATVDNDYLSMMVELNRGRDGVSVPVHLVDPAEGECKTIGFKWDEEQGCFLWEPVRRHAGVVKAYKKKSRR